MENKPDYEFENQRLKQTISLAMQQLSQAKLKNEDNKSSILSLKQELRENTSHSISGPLNAQNFEDLVELSQFTNPIINKMADYDATANRITILERMLTSPYFARIDFKYDDEENYEMIYIGRHSLVKDSSFEMMVYDWRSPVASVFYRFGTGPAFYDAPNGKITGNVGLKRQYEIKNGVLEYFFDADVQIIDEFLRKMLSRNTSLKMKTIVETIQKEQDTVIRDMNHDLMMVQGAAGSGKTSVALHRAAYLMYQGLASKLSAGNIIIISPNTLFERYISNVLPELGENNVVSSTFDEILQKILRNKTMQTKNQFLERLVSTPKLRSIMKRTIEFKTSPVFSEILDRFIHDLPGRWIAFEDIRYNGKLAISKETLKERILSGRKETPLGFKLRQLEDFILESLETPGRRHANKRLRKSIRQFTQLNAENLYRMLLTDEDYFFELSKGLELPGCIRDILRFTRKNLSGPLCYDDAAAAAYLKLRIDGAGEYRIIKQVVIDEAQDYYPLHYEIFNLLFPGSKYTILGDINQTLEKHEDLSLYQHIEKILNRKKSIFVTMDKSFRCTNEILLYSSKFIPHNAEMKSFNRSGDEPEVHGADSHSALCDKIASEVKHCLDEGYESVGLVCRSEKNALALFEGLKDRIDIQLVKSDSGSDLSGTFVIPVYMSKGLEFDAVLICDADSENYSDEDDKKLLYIGCTRALHRLNLFYCGKASPLL